METSLQPFCESSHLTIPSDSRYAGVAGRYAAEVARIIGFDTQAQDQIYHGIQAGLPGLMQYSFEAQERGTLDVSCERIPAGLRIVVQDKGLPFGAAGPWPADADVADNAFLSLRDHFDEIHFNNLGQEGKEVVLVKHLPDASLADYEAACRLQPPDASEAMQPFPQAQAATRCRVRPLGPSDAPEISKTVYKTYGYSYSHDYVYYPEKIVALNASGEVHSALAVTEKNEIVGHAALSLWSDNPQIAEMGQGVVVPHYRSLGCFVKLTEYLIDTARSRGLKGVFGEAVTLHPFSQKTGLQYGLRDCALFLCMIPLTVDFKGMGTELSSRGSMLVQFKYLEEPGAAEVYAPPQHAEMLRAIYTNLDSGTVPRFSTASENVREEGESVYKIDLIRSLSFTRIRVERYGSNIVSDIRHKLRELCLQHWEVIHLILNLSDPQTPHFCRRFEELGFFFAGVLPLGLASGDALILQYLNTYCVPYSAIQAASPFGADLVAYVKSLDPNLAGT